MSDTNSQAIAALENVALENVKESKRRRRWGIFFRFAFLGVFLLMALGMLFSAAFKSGKFGGTTGSISAVVDIKGVIMDGTGVNYNQVAATLKEVYEDPRTKGVILRINSPGGSAVQSAMIYDEIQRQKKAHEDIPVYAVIHDVGASGGYYIAASADKIFANKSSIVGSIGVRIDSYGLVEAAKKLGVESRTLTAGENKGILDPFKPVTEADREHIETMLNDTHEEFINAVKEGRGDRLKPTKDTFSGLFWSGKTAHAMGLIDGFMTEDQISKDLIKADEWVSFTPEKSLIEQVLDQSGKAMLRMLSGAEQAQLSYR